MATKLCLNMIVKNEAAILERCLRSVADHIACWVICDTGSTDGTQDLIRDFFAQRGIPGELHAIPFHDFEQARNQALDLASVSPFVFDYVLLTDADMELATGGPGFADGFTADAYVALQRSEAMYWNVRFLHRSCPERYKGLTHEALTVPGEQIGVLDTAWFIDHACGANRVDKYERDIRLLRLGLEREPDSSRTWFYLAQSLLGAGRYAEAADAFEKRIAAGGWAEEVWFARLQQARCRLNMDDPEGFVRAALTAYSERPHRAEPLYDLAKFHRALGRIPEALAFSEAALDLSYPPGNDTLFTEDWVYDRGVRLEYALAASEAGNEAQRAKGHGLCEWLALTPQDRPDIRDLAHEAGGLYAVPAASLLPSLRLSQVRAPAGISPGSPALLTAGGEILLGVAGGAPSGPKGFLLQLDDDLAVRAAVGIACPDDPAHPGFADMRLIAWKGDLWALSTADDPDATGAPSSLLSRLVIEDGVVVAKDRRALPSQHCDRGNLIPQADGDALRFLVGLDPVRVLDLDGGGTVTTVPPVVLHRAGGSTPMLPFDGGWLCVVRETGDAIRRSTHRFLWFDGGNVLRRLSRRFTLCGGTGCGGAGCGGAGDGAAGETVAGLARHPDGQRILLSFGLQDGTSWLALAPEQEVRAALTDATAIAPPGIRLAWPASAVRDGATPLLEPPPASPIDAIHVPSVRSFDLFDTLVARRCVHPTAIFDAVERNSGHAGFARRRVAAEAELLSGPYTLDLIYARLADRYGVAPDEAARLRAMEIEAEYADLFPVAQHCAEVGRDDIIVSDMYLPAEMLRHVVHQTCGLPGRRVVVTANGKHFGTVWPAILTVQPVREHLGDNPHSDGTTPRRAGIPARITTVTARTEVETELADAGFVPLSNLVREARLTTWLADPLLRRAQLAQTGINVPFLFLNTLHLLRRAAEHEWDHILFSGRDCYLWTTLYDGLRPHLPAMPSACYFHTGRAVRLRPSADYVAYFDGLRAGRRNVVVDLCGLGVSLRQLLTQAPQPDTSIYLVHQLLMPEFQQQYEAVAARDVAAGRPSGYDWPIHSAFSRPPARGDNDVMEELNRAPYAGLEDVRVTADGFEPIFCGPVYAGETARIFNVHQAAFRHACTLLPTLARSEVEAMLARDALPMILSLYGRLPGLLSDLVPFIHHKNREDDVLSAALQRSEAPVPVTLGA